MVKCVVAKKYEDVWEKGISRDVRPDWVVIEGDYESLSSKYNAGLEGMEIEDSDVVVFLHADVRLIDEDFYGKVERVFVENPLVGLVGVYGTTELNRTGAWWMSGRELNGRGHIVQGHPERGLSYMRDWVGFFDDVVSVDGCMLAFRGKLFSEGFRFDEGIGGFHFYDVDSSFEVLRRGYKVAVADILIQHNSVGEPDESWLSIREDFLRKWEGLGYKFPVTTRNFKNPQKD